MSARLLQARNVLRQAERNYHAALLAEYPVGSTVKWVRGMGPRLIEGEVIECGTSGRILVRRRGVTRSHWIYADDIARASEFAAAGVKAAA